MTRSLSRLLLSLVLLGIFGSGSLWAKAADKKRAEIREDRDAVLAELYRLKPDSREEIQEADGYAVFSNVGINLLVVSTASGRGLVVEKGTFKDTETFMRMASVGVGFGAGVKDFRAVFIFRDRAKLRDFIEKGWDFSGQADAAVKSDKKGDALALAATVIPGVKVYQLTKNGIALQATLQGTKYWKDKKLN
jgi:lipid-binding SYLF domain-containing protein